MKNHTGIIFLILLVVMLSSCIETSDKYQRISDTEAQAVIERCTADTKWEVPTKEGYTTVVKKGNDTIAIVSNTITLSLPNGTEVSEKSTNAAQIKTTTRDDDNKEYTFEYVKGILDKDNAAHVAGWSAVLFEDTKNGDFDYNDLIIHTNTQYNVNWNENTVTINVYIQPIALGSTLTIKLGVYLPDGEKKYISDDCRKTLFEGKTGYINTQTDQEHIFFTKLKRYITKTFTDNTIINDFKSGKGYVIWFIEAGGNTFYAPTQKLDIEERQNMVSDLGYPYGLNTTTENGTFKNYPIEKQSITKGYPKFADWITGKLDGTFEDVVLKDKDSQYLVPAFINNVDTWGYKWEN